MYILKVNVLLYEENCTLETNLIDAISNLVDSKNGLVVSINTNDIIGDNFGKCENCGCWVSNYDMDNYVPEFSNGCIINKKWLCDICLPPNHPKAFQVDFLVPLWAESHFGFLPP